MPQETAFEFDKNPRKYILIRSDELALYQNLLPKLDCNYLSRKALPSTLHHSIIKGENRFYILSRCKNLIPNGFLGRGQFGKIKAAAAIEKTKTGYELSANTYAVKRFYDEHLDHQNECKIFKILYGFAELIKVKGKTLMVMPKFPGIQLPNREFIQRLNMEEFTDLVVALTKSFMDLTNKEIINHDLALDSIIYDFNNKRAYIIDFGKAQVATDTYKINQQKLIEVLTNTINIRHGKQEIFKVKNLELYNNLFELTQATVKEIVNLLWNETNHFTYNESVKALITFKIKKMFKEISQFVLLYPILTSTRRSRY